MRYFSGDVVTDIGIRPGLGAEREKEEAAGTEQGSAQGELRPSLQLRKHRRLMSVRAAGAGCRRAPSHMEAGIKEPLGQSPALPQPSACPLLSALITWGWSHLLWTLPQQLQSHLNLWSVWVSLFFIVWFCFFCQLKMKGQCSQPPSASEADWHWPGPFPSPLNSPIHWWRLSSWPHGVTAEKKWGHLKECTETRGVFGLGFYWGFFSRFKSWQPIALSFPGLRGALDADWGISRTALLREPIPHTQNYTTGQTSKALPHHHPEKRQWTEDPDRRGFPHSCASVGTDARGPDVSQPWGPLAWGKVGEKDLVSGPPAPGSRAIQALPLKMESNCIFSYESNCSLRRPQWTRPRWHSDPSQLPCATIPSFSEGCTQRRSRMSRIKWGFRCYRFPSPALPLPTLPALLPPPHHPSKSTPPHKAAIAFRAE